MWIRVVRALFILLSLFDFQLLIYLIYGNSLSQSSDYDFQFRTQSGKMKSGNRCIWVEHNITEASLKGAIDTQKHGAKDENIPW